MARLTESQLKNVLKRDRRKQEALKKKQEAQKNKEIYGENWKQILRQNLEREFELEFGSEKVPRLQDFVDLYSFFDPITFYKDGNNQFQMDLKKFQESEKKYNKIIQEANKAMQEAELEAKQVEEDNKIKNKNKKENEEIDKIIKESKERNLSEEEKKELEQKQLQNYMELDGGAFSDDVSPLSNEELKKNEEQKNNEDGVNKNNTKTDNKSKSKNKKQDDIIDKEVDEEIKKRKRNSTISLAKAKMNQIVSMYINRFVPIYNKYICTCCGTPMNINDFYITSNITCNSKIDSKGNYHLHVCKTCCQKLLQYFYSTIAEKNIELAMQYMCSYLNLYWDVDSFYLARQQYEDNDREGTLIGAYIGYINSNFLGKTFMDSPFLHEEQESSRSREIIINPEEAPFDWSKEDAKNKKQVLRMVGYDPYVYETEENKKFLYRDLLNILEDGMENDFVKFQAAIQIVRSFFMIRQYDQQMYKMQQEGAETSEIKAIADLKVKELKSITDFAKDNGFSERYATKKSKGENTLTGIMNKMNSMKYEKAVVNRYDIATSETIQQAADASIKAIFNQLSLSDSEMWKITQDQLEELRKLRRQNENLEEDLRKARYELAEIRLQEKERLLNAERGIEDDDDY